MANEISTSVVSRTALEAVTCSAGEEILRFVMEQQGSFFCSQQPATWLYLWPVLSSLQTSNCKIHFNIIIPSMSRSPKSYLHFAFPE
jgi:hypothetical protein